MLRSHLRNPAVMQVLSLYLILLAIFVMLYSISRSEPARVRTVTGSLTAAFRSAGVPTREAEVLVSLDGTLVARSAAQKKFGRLIESAIPLSRIVILQPGRVMHARLPVAELFMAGDAALRDDRKPLVEELAELLDEAPGQMRFDLEAVVGDTNFLSGGASGKALPLAQARAAALARSLMEAGAPPGSTGAAVDREGRGWVRLIFRIEGGNEARGAAVPPLPGGTSR